MRIIDKYPMTKQFLIELAIAGNAYEVGTAADPVASWKRCKVVVGMRGDYIKNAYGRI